MSPDAAGRIGCLQLAQNQGTLNPNYKQVNSIQLPIQNMFHLFYS